MKRSLPPLASPHGEDTWPFAPPPDENCARVKVRLRLASALRYVLVEPLIPAMPMVVGGGSLLWALLAFPAIPLRFDFGTLFLIFVLSFGVIVAVSLLAMLVVRLCSQRRFEVWLSPAGLFKRYPNRDIFFAWSKFVWVLEWRGDLWLTSFCDGCFIPREAFASGEEAREFVQIVLELKRTKGSVWRDKWSGRSFGVQAELLP